VGLVQKTRTKPPVQILCKLFAGVLFPVGFCQGVFCLEGFVRGGFCPFLLLSEYICYNRKLNITLNVMFDMYDNKMYKRDVTCSWPLPLSQTVTPSQTPPPRAWRTLWTAPHLTMPSLPARVYLALTLVMWIYRENVLR